MSDKSIHGILFPCKLVRSTSKAHLVEVDDPELEGMTKEIWLPDSQIEFYENETTVSIPRWLAESKGLV